MRPLYEAKCIQILITSKCNLRCASCSQLVGHHKRETEMSLGDVRNALESLEGYKGMVGIFGGEPTLHSKFKEIVQLYSMYIPRARRGLWTNGFNWVKYQDLIYKTFPLKNIVYNSHQEDVPGFHQPLLVSCDEITEDKDLMWEMINHCWVNERWSPILTTRGAYFCEVASAIAAVYNEPGWDYSLNNSWWKKAPAQFQDQVTKYCKRCGMCVPLPPLDAHGAFEYITPNNLENLVRIGVPNLSKFEVYTKTYTREDYLKYKVNWRPGHFRDFYQHEPNVKLTKEQEDALEVK